MVREINPGFKSGLDYDVEFFVRAGLVYFVADDGVHGKEIWQTDGSSAGTQIAYDVFPGAMGSNPQHIAVLDNTLYFSAHNGGAGYEPFKLDGTASGNTLIADISPQSPVESSNPGLFVALDDEVLFVAKDGKNGGNKLWRTDGTTEGTGILFDVNPGGDTLLYELYKLGQQVFFSAEDGVHGPELWVSDGTSAGTRLVKDLMPGPYGNSIGIMVGAGGIMYFEAIEHSTNALWRSDGTEEGTYPVLQFNDYIDGVANYIPGGDRLFFTRINASGGTELWVSDGTENGTRVVREMPGMSIFTGSNAYGNPGVSLNGDIYFVAGDNVDGIWLWKSDGTAGGTVKLMNVEQDPQSGSQPIYLEVIGNHVYFVADDGISGDTLWQTDGTISGTRMVKDIVPGAYGGVNSRLMRVKDRLYFLVKPFEGVRHVELWTSNGTTAGTARVKEINSGADDVYGYQAAGDFLYFSYDTPEAGTELWRIDGSAAGTYMVKDVYPGRTGGSHLSW